MVFFNFEADFVDSLRCIPMQVRMKLDTCGVKLKLSHWHHLEQDQRQLLVNLPCETETESLEYRQTLQDLLIAKTGGTAAELPIHPHPLWLESNIIPTDVQNQAASFGVQLTLTQWANLTPLQRFALIKLSRPGHENHNFFPALQEFGLAVLPETPD